jgi:DNA-binding beta-propeller fold protein YncE
MRVYGLADQPMAKSHPCDLRADLGLMPAKAVFGFPPPGGGPARLVYSDLGNVYVYDRALKATFRLDHAKYRVLASAFPGLTQDGRVIYAATWHDCDKATACPERAGYVVIDPYQATSYRQYWQAHGKTPPKACITQTEVVRQRAAFARRHGIAP